MLATLDDISNLNLNNLVGSALGLWDQERTHSNSLFFLLSVYFPLSCFRSHWTLLSFFPSLFQQSALLYFCTRYYIYMYQHVGRTLASYYFASVLAKSWDLKLRWSLGDFLLIFNWSNIYKIVSQARDFPRWPSQTAPSWLYWKILSRKNVCASLFFFSPFSLQLLVSCSLYFMTQPTLD